MNADAAHTISQLKQMGLQVRMLTGDQTATAMAMAQELNLDACDIEAEVTPADKAMIIAQLQAQGHCIGMVGDGINDAPALAQANVGIALSGGTDVAMETAQIILMSGHAGANSLFKIVMCCGSVEPPFTKSSKIYFGPLFIIFWPCRLRQDCCCPRLVFF